MEDSIIIQRIKQRMKELGLNSRKLAEKAHVGKSFVYDVLSGKSRNPTSSKLALISKELGVSISYLIGDSNVGIDLQDYALVHSINNTNINPEILLHLSLFNLSQLKDLRMLNIEDDNMYPALTTRDLVIIEIRSIDDDYGVPVGLFAIKREGNIIIRRLQYLGSNKVKVAAENEIYSYEDDINQIDLVGKVKYIFRKL